MQRFRKILLVADGPDGGGTILERTISLAKYSGATLTVLAVVADVPHNLTSWLAQARVLHDELQSRRIAHRTAQLDKLVEPVRAAGIEVRTRVRIGKKSIEITRDVLQNGHDLVIKAAEEVRPLRHLVFASADLQLMRQCPCPVWIHRASTAHYKTILAAVDPGPPSLPSADSPDEALWALNERILRLATAIADIDQCELHVVHVWDVFSENFLRTSLDATEKEIERLVRTVENEHRLQLERLLAEFRNTTPVPKPHFVKGSPDEAIPRLASELGADLIVMGTVCRTGLAGFIIGNTAETILGQVDSSVLTVKPAGFVTPVHPAE